jgi:hypothetical protein
MNRQYLIIMSIVLTSCSGGKSSLLADGEGWKDTCPWQSNRDFLLDSRLLTADGTGLSQLGSLVPASDPDTAISADDALADLACLRTYMIQSYAGLEFYHKKGIDLVARLDELAKKMGNPSSHDGSRIEVADLVDNIFDLHRDAPDAHLVYKRVIKGQESEPTEVRKTFETRSINALPWEFSRSVDGVLTPEDPQFQSIQLRSCQHFSLVRSLSVSRGRSGELPQFSYALVSQDEMTGNEQANCELLDGSRVLISVREIKPKSYSKTEGFSYTERPDGVIYVRLASFLDAVDAPKMKLLAMLSQDSESRPIVFDLRANRGGGNGYVEKLAATLRAAGEPVKSVVQKNKLSRYSVTGFLNTLGLMYLEASSASSDKDPLWQRLEKSRKGLFSWAETQLSPHQVEWTVSSSQEEVRPARVRAYQGKIILLVDKNCASECESFIEVLQDLPHVTVVGTPTNGAMHFSNVGSIVLPHSKIMARLGMALTTYDPVIDAPEMIGHEPQIYFLDGSDDEKLELAVAVSTSPLASP